MINENNRIDYLNLSEYTGFGTGGKAKSVYAPGSLEELLSLSAMLKQSGEKVYILGNGSNVIARDEGFDGTIILTRSLKDISVENTTTLKCSAGALLTDVCRYALRLSLKGLENLYGIPGSVGGAVFMNAGAYGREIKDLITEVTVADENFKIIKFKNEQCKFGYRYSIFQENSELIILSAEFKLEIGDKDEILNKMKDVMSKRKASQPLEYKSCGSTFKRPTDNYASKLIEQCGLKGFSIGGAKVSEKHAGFIINFDNASSEDIFRLITTIQNKVKEKTGYELVPEVRVME